MDALGLTASRSNAACSSVEDLQGQLHQLLAAKTTDTRAEHITPSFELVSHAALHIPADSEKSAPDGTDGDAEPAQLQQQHIARTVMVSEAVNNQPADDPILQQAIAKHISNAIGAVDTSAWTVRQVTRGAQGWQFTYICKASLQAWKRANAKNPDRPVIASYSGSGGLDPINLSRPAFDCRGTLTIAFSKSSRAIVVKYEHTPLHKTVTQLVERFVPAPIPVRIDPHATQRTPKPKRPRPADGESSRKQKTPKAKPSSADGGEGSQKKKRTPKSKRPPPADGVNGEGSSRKRRKTGKAAGSNAGGVEDAINAQQSQAQPQNAANKTNFPGFLNVPPAEAERRRQTAIELLSGKGIDPATLSPEQFNIFANQAPNLQTASLEMLAKYGAERLRIVHPDEKEQAESLNSTPATEQATNSVSGAATGPAPGSTSTPTKKPRNKKRKSDAPPTEVSIGNGAVIPLEQDGGLGTTESALKPKARRRVRKTRGRCDTCKQRKVQCTKEHPSCSVCIDAGVDCIYLPPKPRRKSEKSSEMVEQEDSDLPEDGDTQQEAENSGQTSAPDPPQSHAMVVSQPPPDIENEEFIPDPNILSGPVEQQTGTNQTVNAHTYYQHSHSEAGFPQLSSAQEATPAAGTTSMPGLTYPQAQTNEVGTQPGTTVAYPSTSVQMQQSHTVSTSQPIHTSTPHQQTQSTSLSNRKSLPTSQAKQTPIPPPTMPPHSPNWGSSATMHQPTSTSPTSAHQQAAKRPKSRRSRAEPEPQGHDSLKQAASQPTKYQSPMTRSPYQSAARVNSRQGHRSQTTTPVATSSQPPPQAPTTTHQSTTSASSYSIPATSNPVPHYDPYPQYNSNRNEQYNDAGNENSSSRITYESNSYQTNTTTAAPSYSSVPSYDYGRASGAVNPLSQALNDTSTTYSGATGSTTNQWPTSQTRGTRNSTSASAYALPASSASTTHNYNTRASESRASNQNTSYQQAHPQSYNSYPSQQSNINQPNQQNWYGFTATNSNNNQASYASNRQNAHGSHRAAAPVYSSQYTGNDEQAIYDLLRAGSSHH